MTKMPFDGTIRAWASAQLAFSSYQGRMILYLWLLKLPPNTGLSLSSFPLPLLGGGDPGLPGTKHMGRDILEAGLRRAPYSVVRSAR